MLKKLKTLFMWIGIILSMLIAWRAYEEYRFQRNYQRAMELLGETEKPDVVIDKDGTIRGQGYEFRP